jgi:excisionase family DNA binding protein
MEQSETYKTTWTTKELAEFAGVSPRYIRQLLKDGVGLKGVKRGRDWFISDSEAKRWLEERAKIKKGVVE